MEPVMKFLKWFFIAILAVSALLILYITLIFDPNDYKPKIIDLVKEKTGRELTINSKLAWTFFPRLGIKLGGITLSNPKGFTHPNMLSINEVVADVSLLPLLAQKVEISQLNLDGLSLSLETQKDGSSSVDGLITANNQPDPAAVTSPASEEASQGASVSLAQVNIGGINITNTQISHTDHLTDTQQTLAVKSLTLDRFELDKFTRLQYALTATLPKLSLTSTGTGQIKISQNLQQVMINDFVVNNQLKGAEIPNGELNVDLNTSLELALDKKDLRLVLASINAAKLTASGQLDIAYGNAVPNIVAKLEVGDVDLDHWLPQPASKDDTPTTRDESHAGGEPDLTAMKSVNLAASVTVKSVKVAKMSTENWVMKLNMKQGVATMSQLSADLYSGTLNASATLDGRRKVARYQFDKQLKGVNIHTLLMDAADIDLLDGTANFKVAGKGASLLPNNMKKNLVADGQFSITDGALHGVNIPQMIRDAKAKLSGDFSASDAVEKKTDFTHLTGRFNVAQGVVNNNTLDMASPLIRLSGAGTANMINEALNYKLVVSVVGSLKGQGGDKRDALYGIEVPLMIEGSVSDPQFSLDTQALLNSRFKEETNKLKDSLLKKFGGF